MASSELPTQKTKAPNLIVVVGFRAAFVRRCEEAAAGTAAMVVSVALGEEAFSMQELPLAVVMERDAIRTSKLAQIARELGIGLIAVPDEEVGVARLKELIEGAFAAASWARKRAR